MQPAELIIILCAICICALLAHRLKLAPPVSFLLGGIALALIPGMHIPELEPEYMLLLFLPPILMEAAFFTSIREFRANLRAILSLAVGLVLLTAGTTAAVLVALLPAAPWALGFVLGAIISPPDAAAATSALRGAPIPRRIVSVLEGESLVNDATGIVMYKFAVAAVLVGSFSLGGATLEFAWKAGAGIIAGLAIAYFFVRMYPLFKEPSVEILSTFIPPYAAYLVAESIHASGVLAVVAAGLLIGWHSPNLFNAKTRAPAEAVWRMVVFFINALAFLLIGLQLPGLIQRLNEYGIPFLLLSAACVSLAAIAVRFAYTYLLSYVPRVLPRNRKKPLPAWQNIFLVSWTGMRGVVTLALAIALPHTLSNGEPFPYRDLIIFLAVSVILVTLVIQGLTLPWLINSLTLRFDPKRTQEEWLARVNIARRALTTLDELEQQSGTHMPALMRIRSHYEERLESLGDGPNTPLDGSSWSASNHPLVQAENRLWQAVLNSEREMLLHMRREFTIDDELMHDMLREMDLRESSFRYEGDDTTGNATEKRRLWERFHKKAAFSLVELSIVLVILGLLTGGILASKSLIRASELRSVSTEYNRNYTAIKAFRDKYFAIPGDMSNATSFWGSSTSCPGTAGTGTQTCNGNASGFLDAGGVANNYDEYFTFWQHLANAGLIEGTYNGIIGASGGQHATTANSPSSKLTNGLWFVGWDASSGGAFFPVALTRHNLRLGGSTSNAWPRAKLVTPEEMWNVDSKMDDGLPGTGKLTAPHSGYATIPDCATTNVASTAIYELTITSAECIFVFDAGI